MSSIQLMIQQGQYYRFFECAMEKHLSDTTNEVKNKCVGLVGDSLKSEIHKIAAQHLQDLQKIIDEQALHVKNPLINRVIPNIKKLYTSSFTSLEVKLFEELSLLSSKDPLPPGSPFPEPIKV